MGEDEDPKSTLARHDERLKNLEKTQEKMDGRIWAALIGVAGVLVKFFIDFLQAKP